MECTSITESSIFEPSLLGPDYRRAVTDLQDKMLEVPGVLIGGTPECTARCPLKHTFTDGMYIREIFIPKGVLIVSKLHKKKHPYFILEGDVTVADETGTVRIIAPYSGVTEAGTKRVVFTNEDTVWITVHATNSTDLSVIEKEIIAETFDDLDTVDISEVI